MAQKDRAEGGRANRILASLESEDRERLLADTTLETLEFKRVLLQPGKAIDAIYFPESAVISLLTTMEDGGAVEVATVGNEGLVGVPVFLGGHGMSARDLYQVQVPGQARTMDTEAFLKASGREPLRGLVQRYAQALFTQVSQQVACNALHSVTERCSRWMLLTADRVDQNKFPLTQEFLAQMLGVRRASVTVAAGTLQHAGFIRYARGWVTIVDREGLENSACECYRIIRTEFDRLLP
jgi:CRP-like cAMP-binding protein